MKVNVNGRTHPYRTVTFDNRTNSVLLIEQRLLPHEFKVISAPDFRATARSIKDMVVRGAPAIAATAAYGLAQGARIFQGTSLLKFARHVRMVYETIKAARPTAVDPVNAMDQLLATMSVGETVPEQQALALAAAEDFAHRLLPSRH